MYYYQLISGLTGFYLAFLLLTSISVFQSAAVADFFSQKDAFGTNTLPNAKTVAVNCHFMKILPAIIISIIWTPASAQDTISIKRDINAEVLRIQHESNLKPITFSIQAMKKVLHYLKYTYTADVNGFVKINRQFSRNNDTTRQTFYLKKGELIFATEQIVPYYTENNKTDSITWSADFYFSKGRLIDHGTLDHGKSELDTWNPEHDILTSFNESKKDIDRYKRRKTAATSFVSRGSE